MSNGGYHPGDPKTYAVRPINQGVFRNEPEAEVPKGGLLDAANFIVGQKGPYRRPAILSFAGGASVSYPPVQHITSFWSTSGTKQTLLFDKKFMYKVTRDGLTQVTWEYNTGTVTVSSTSTTTVSGSSTNWITNMINAGDIITIDPSGNAEVREITAVTSESELEIDSSLDNTYSGASYKIDRAFRPNNQYRINTASKADKLYIADGNKPLVAYDGTSLSFHGDITDKIPTCVAYHGDRVFIANVLEGGNSLRHRIRWSNPLDDTNLINSGDTWWLDLPYVQGEIRRLVPLGPYLVAYFTDSVWLGRPTQRAGNALPYSFDRLDTAGIGLVGTHAVEEWLDSHIFVGGNDVYSLSVDRSLQRIGSRIANDVVFERDELYNTQVAVDRRNRRVLIGFQGDGGRLEKMWGFQWDTQAWSYDVINADMIGTSAIFESETWETIGDGADTWESIDDRPWDVPAEEYYADTVWVGINDKLYYYSKGGALDFDSNTIDGRLIFPDIDNGRPDITKRFGRLSFAIDRILANDLNFTVSVSTDRGITWNQLGRGTIPAGKTEGIAHFVLTSTIARFKIETSSEVSPYYITEVVFRIRGIGLQTDVTEG